MDIESTPALETQGPFVIYQFYFIHVESQGPYLAILNEALISDGNFGSFQRADSFGSHVAQIFIFCLS